MDNLLVISERFVELFGAHLLEHLADGKVFE
jgi:hypothetical protein